MALKRGALVAAANWPVALAQAAADALFKVLVAAPLVGGLLLATLVIGADIDTSLTGDWRLLAATLVSSLLQHRVVLIAFLLVGRRGRGRRVAVRLPGQGRQHRGSRAR